jgi:arylsulfatase A-like enzyme
VKRPNILFIMADDLGYADIGCYGRTDISTPNIDSLASTGLKFVNAYASSCVCSPTRISLLTGCYPGRFDAGLDEPLSNDAKLGLAADAPSFVSRLKDAGYQTSLVGKWHLGHARWAMPQRKGYERFFGSRSGGTDYFTHRDYDGASDLWEDEVEIQRSGYMTNLLGERAVSEVRRMAANAAPFLLSLHFTAPHWPWETEEDEKLAQSLRSIQHYDGGSSATYRAMIESMDRQIGSVLGALKASGEADNTIVVFTSDNGGERFSNVWPHSGRKGELLEGGIRVPQLVRWPRGIRAKSVSNEVTATMDWAPTLLAAAGIAPAIGESIDGTSILPTFAGAKIEPRTLFWRYKAHAQKAAIRWPYKLLSIGGAEYLFDVAADPLERANLKGREKGIYEALSQEWKVWDARMLPYTEKNQAMDNKKRGMPDRY